jgi:hypothetical protein
LSHNKSRVVLHSLLPRWLIMDELGEWQVYTLAHCTTTNPKNLTTIIAASKNNIFPFVIFPLPWQHGFINTRFHTNYHMK